MFTTEDLLKIVLAPLLVAGLLAAIGWWRRWAWAMPLATGAGFLTGFGLLGVPRMPPLDGTDWLFWLAMPLTVVGVVAALLNRWWSATLGIVTAGMVLIIVRPLTPHSVPIATIVNAAILLGLVSAAVCFAIALADARIGSLGTIGSLSLATAAAAVVVVSSNIRIVGLHGLAAAAALVPVALLSAKLGAGRGVAVFAVPLMAGLLAGGHFYAEPGLAWTPLLLILASPALAAVGMLIPGQRWLRAAAAILAVAILVGVVAGPIALKAKRDAERAIDPNDPSTYYR